MNKRIKQFYKQWVESYDSILSIEDVYFTTEEDFYNCDKAFFIASPSHAFEHNIRVYTDKDVFEESKEEFSDNEWDN